MLSPVEVIANRQRYRDAVSASIKRRRELWPLDHLDVFMLAGEEPLLAFDVRQDEVDSWLRVGKEGSTSTHGLGHLLGWAVNETYVDALVKLHPQLKKLNYGQSVAELGGKATKKPASKPAAKRRTSKPKPTKPIKPIKKAKAKKR